MTEAIAQIMADRPQSAKMTRHVGAAAVLAAALCLFSGKVHAENCANLPTSFTGNEFPTGDFFTNFNNSCYTINFSSGDGAHLYGDLNARYYMMYYKADPRYQLILVSAFPNARYYSVALYDEHSALTQTMLDTSIVPLTSQYVNPFLPGVPFADGQQFALPIQFGGTGAGTPETGCVMNGYNVQTNSLDATQRHTGMDWNSDADFFQLYPKIDYHNVDTARHQNPNTAGLAMIRVYMDSTVASYATKPHIIVRDVASGCAYPADYAVNTLQIVTNVGDTGRAWMDQTQVTDHHIYTSYLPQLCYGPGPVPNQLAWSRVEEYVPLTNPDASYISATLPKGLPDTLAAAGEVLRIRVRVPAAPPTPCTNGCSRTGLEQMRYMSLSFRTPDGTVFATLADNAFTVDANGYATLIVGTGAPIPAWVTPANGYTFLDLTTSASYQDLSQITMRHMIPAGTFNCGGQFVPYKLNAQTPAGSLMADYEPVADYPVAASLPSVAVPLVGPDACNVLPVGDPGVHPACGVFAPVTPAISAVVTECHLPTCAYFVAQPKPPMTILGAGFGMFPDGLPFNGATNYLRITDTTQNWVAGYTGSACGVQISSWDTERIQLIANFNQNGACPLSAGDNLLMEVWNPQTGVEAQVTVAVVAPQ